MRTVSIVGIGRMGGALAIALGNAGYAINRLIVRKANSDGPELPVPPVLINELDAIDSDIVLITTGDTEIAVAAEQIKPLLEPGTIVLHTSGLLDSTELGSLRETGCHVGSMHPLISVSDAASGSKSFGNANFCIEGDETAVSQAREMVNSLGGRSFTIPTSSKPLYHASAVMAAGNMVALFDMASEMMIASGIDAQTTHGLLLALLQSVANNLSAKYPADALTGSFARGDLAAFEKHLNAMNGVVSRETEQVFVLLGERSLNMIESAGTDHKSLAEFHDRIKMAKNDLKC